MCPALQHFRRLAKDLVGADDPVGPLWNAGKIARAGRVARPYDMTRKQFFIIR